MLFLQSKIFLSTPLSFLTFAAFMSSPIFSDAFQLHTKALAGDSDVDVDSALKANWQVHASNRNTRGISKLFAWTPDWVYEADPLRWHFRSGLGSLEENISSLNQLHGSAEQAAKSILVSIKPPFLSSRTDEWKDFDLEDIKLENAGEAVEFLTSLKSINYNYVDPEATVKEIREQIPAARRIREHEEMLAEGERKEEDRRRMAKQREEIRAEEERELDRRFAAEQRKKYADEKKGWEAYAENAKFTGGELSDAETHHVLNETCGYDETLSKISKERLQFRKTLTDWFIKDKLFPAMLAQDNLNILSVSEEEGDVPLNFLGLPYNNFFDPDPEYRDQAIPELAIQDTEQFLVNEFFQLTSPDIFSDPERDLTLEFFATLLNDALEKVTHKSKGDIQSYFQFSEEALSDVELQKTEAPEKFWQFVEFLKAFRKSFTDKLVDTGRNKRSVVAEETRGEPSDEQGASTLSSARL
jgi:hypothetical protein